MGMTAHSLFGRAVLWAGLLSATACTAPTSGPQSALAPTAPAARQQAQVSTATEANPLLAGSFTIADEEGDAIVGTYTGTSRFLGGGSQTASVTLQITSGSGKFAGVTGSFTLNGVGAFADEGSFFLNGQGEVALAGEKRSTIVLNLRGTSVATCSSQQVLISQTATGALGHAGRVTATLSHVVGNAGCSG